MADRARELGQLVSAFDRLAEVTAEARAGTVMTHGEPHPANLMSEGDRVMSIDWDTAALGPPERDLALIATADGDGVERYERATGREISPEVMSLYRLRWYLDDLASAARLFKPAP
jgi:spectinomycin phosphotransferase